MNRLSSLFSNALLLLAIVTCFQVNVTAQHSIAHQWNEVNLAAVRNNGARPTVISRNLFHHSILMYDMWAVYAGGDAETYFLGKQLGNYPCPFDGVPAPTDVDAAIHEAMSYASFRLLMHRYVSDGEVGDGENEDIIEGFMASLGYDEDVTSIDYSDGTPAHLGNYIASRLISAGFTDGSNEVQNYFQQYYEEVNPVLDMRGRGNDAIQDMNRWQRMLMNAIWDQPCLTLFSGSRQFIGPEWGNVVPFALDDSVKTEYTDERGDWNVYHDPGPPPLFDTIAGDHDDYLWGFEIVGVWSSHLDPADTEMWDISPASIGNIPLESLPNDPSEYPDFYDFFEGGDASLGHAINPHTGLPYEPQIVKRSDYARILAEFWADGPDSEAPPGHWHTIYNAVSDYPEFSWKWEGVGEPLDHLEFDVKAYLTMGGAMHDAAVAAWGAKGYYDYVRPVAALRAISDKYGQRTDPTQTESYHPFGIDLIPGYIEIIQEGDTVAIGDSLVVASSVIADSTFYLLNEIKMKSWLGPGNEIPCDTLNDSGTPVQYPTDVSGVGWRPIQEWWPYQRPTFVTPPFAGYVSGHSTFSRAAAEVMTAITGDNFFPGGMGVFECPADSFLVFEEGPTEDIELQWATYQDASDQCSLSRIWGGIHPPADDIPGRKMGYEVGVNAFTLAQTIFDPIAPEVVSAFASDELINDADAGTVLTFTIVYDELMDTDRLPTVMMDSAPQGLTEQSVIWDTDSTVVFSFAVSDMDEQVGGFSFSVDDAADRAGNIQASAALAFFYMDTENPSMTLSDFQENGTPLTSYTFTFTASETMDVSSTPLFETPIEDALTNSLSLNSSSWLDGLTYQMEFDLLDADEDIEEIDVRLSMAADSVGNAMLILNSTDVFSLDTKAPLPSVISPSANTINDEVATTGTFSIEVVFDEEMDQSVVPEILLSPDPAVANTLEPITSEWTDAFTHLYQYSVTDEDSEVSSVDIGFSSGGDLHGNQLEAAMTSNVFSIDSRNPLVDIITANTIDIDNDDTGQATFAILVTFDEGMDMDNVPTIEFPVEDPLAEALVLNEGMSSWLSAQMYEARYDVLNVTEVLEDIDIRASQGTDMVGNVQVLFDSEDVFSIHLDMEVGLLDLGGLPISAVYPNPAMIDDQVTIELSEMVSGLSIDLIDLNGRSVQEQEIVGPSRRVLLDLGEVSEGMYLLLLENDGKRSMVKLHVQH